MSHFNLGVVLFALVIFNTFYCSGWSFSKRFFSIWILVFVVGYPALASKFGTYTFFSESEVVDCITLFLMFSIFFYVSYSFTSFSKLKQCRVIHVSTRALWSIVPITMLLLLDANNWDWVKLFVRAGVDSLFESNEYSPWSLIIKNYVRSFAFFCLFFWLINVRPNFYKIFLVAGLMLLISFPVSLPRVQVAILYGPILFYYFHKFFNKRFAIEWFVVFSLVTVFVGLDFFRKYDDYLESFDYMEYFLSGHFDAFENFMYLLRSDYVSYGVQLIGALGFFIPRVLWPTKPIGSGAHTAMLQDLPADNIAMPLAGEGFINFGIFGVALFAIVAGIISKRIDSLSVNSALAVNTTYYFIYKVTFAMLFFFILRGDLMSGLSFTVASMGALSTITLLFTSPQKVAELHDDQTFTTRDT